MSTNNNSYSLSKDIITVLFCFVFSVALCAPQGEDCSPIRLPLGSDFIEILDPSKSTNWFLSTNPAYRSISIRVYPSDISPGDFKQQINLSISIGETCDDVHDYFVQSDATTPATIYIEDAEIGEYITYVSSDGPYFIQACESTCVDVCTPGCTANGYCDVRKNSCTCKAGFQGVSCEIHCSSKSCEPLQPKSAFPLFGNLFVTLLLVVILPLVLIVVIAAAITQYFRSVNEKRNQEHTQPILIYQSLPYQNLSPEYKNY